MNKTLTLFNGLINKNKTRPHNTGIKNVNFETDYSNLINLKWLNSQK